MITRPEERKDFCGKRNHRAPMCNTIPGRTEGIKGLVGRASLEKPLNEQS